MRAHLRAIEQGAGPKSKQNSFDMFLTPTPKKRRSEDPIDAFSGERGPNHPCTLSHREQLLLDEKKAREKKAKELQQELDNERARHRETGLQAAREQLEQSKDSVLRSR